MHHPLLLEHFSKPRNVGFLPPPAIEIKVENPVCGDMLVLTARIENEKIVSIQFQAKGCTASLACGSALTELLSGKDTKILTTLTVNDVETAVGELPAESKHAATLCIDGVKALARTVAR
jgi:nitrogen fixation protein NifU and related proteins